MKKSYMKSIHESQNILEMRNVSCVRIPCWFSFRWKIAIWGVHKGCIDTSKLLMHTGR